MSELAVEVDVDLEDLPWVIGPTPARPYDAWLPQVVDLHLQLLAVPPGSADHAFVHAVLARAGQSSEQALPYSLLRWLDVRELPLRAAFGPVGRDEDHLVEDFLLARDSVPVEAPALDEVDGGLGRSIRRSLAYSEPDGRLFVEVRYVIDDGNPDALILLHTGDRQPGPVVAALDDLDAVARRMSVRTVSRDGESG